jgi:starch synthase (maltosyl-transferring)
MAVKSRDTGPLVPRTTPTAPVPAVVAAAATTPEIPEGLSRRVIVERVKPAIDGGRFAIKRTPGEAVDVRADIFADGHEVIAALLRDRHGDSPWRETPMAEAAPGSDEWAGRFEVDAIGWHEYAIVAWIDRFRSWRRDLQNKAAAGQEVSIELVEGALLVREAAKRAEAASARKLLAQADALDQTGRSAAERVAVALNDELGSLMDMYADRSRASTTAIFRVWVDRERARFGTWYEMFPRSSGPGTAANRGGTFRDAAARLPYIADLGFDVVYLAPIHPIGKTFRKGHHNSPVAAPTDPGSPWAIGSEAGGHTAIDPGLGTFEDFDAFRAEAERLGLEVALDLAWQCSPDHPWVREHPQWFRHRPDGTIKYAENPPKKYQDIYPLDFECEEWRALWAELLRVTLFWIDRGIRIFRVDNPHTKTFIFWEWLIAEVHARDPRIIFLAEAFTRPKPMAYLAKAGFTQSYTYFTWRNSKEEITSYFSELTGTEVREYLRPNLFTNTPDILHAYLQNGGRPAFEARLILAATLGASYGIYNGFELAENRAVPGTEEYAESEKYQIVHWDWNRPGHIKELVARVNQIRRQNRALQFDWALRFHSTDNPQIIAYSKVSPDRSNILLVVVNLDPHYLQHGWVRAPIDAIGASPQDGYTAHDLIDDVRYGWRGEWNYVRFDPGVRQGHILRLVTRE